MHGCTGRCRKGTGQSAITVHGDGAQVHGKVQGNGAASDNGARGRCRGVRGGAGRGTGQSAITVHRDGVYRWRGPGRPRLRCTGTVYRGTGMCRKGRGRARYNGARACTGRCRGPGQRAITVHGDGARLHGKVQEGDRGRAR